MCNGYWVHEDSEDAARGIVDVDSRMFGIGGVGFNCQPALPSWST